MKLGYNTNGFGSHRLLDAIDVLGGLGYQSIGLTLDHHALDPYGGRWREELPRVREALERWGLEVVIETGARFLLDPQRKHHPTLLSASAGDRGKRVDFLGRASEIGVELGASVLSLWSGRADDDAPEGELDERLARELIELCELLRSREQVMAFEPEPGMYIESMADYERISALVEHEGFQLTLDLGHALLTEESVEETIGRYYPRIRNVHVEGMRRGAHEHLPPWESDYDVQAALSLLVERGYDGPATLELSRGSHQAVELATRCASELSRFLPGSRAARG